MVFVPMAQAPPKAGSKELLYRFVSWVYILGLPKATIAGSLGKAFLQKHAFVSVVGQATAKIRPRPAHGLFSIEKTWYQELYRSTEAIVPMNDRWRKLNANMHQYAPLHTSMGEHCSLSAVQRKTAFGGTVMMGLNWKCLDQCHGVRSHGTSSSQGWRKIVGQSKFDPWVYILVFAGLPAKAFPRNQAFVDISVFRWLRKQQPRFARGQPKGYFQLKELLRTTKAYSQMNVDWKVDKSQYAEFNVPRCGKIAVWQLCKERQPLWNSHDLWWPELKMFGSMPRC